MDDLLALADIACAPGKGPPSKPLACGAKQKSAADGKQQRQAGKEPRHYLETATGIKVHKPVVPGETIELKFKRMQFVALDRLKSHSWGADPGPWVSAGVLSSQEVRSSAQGAPYSVWRLSDLRGGEALVMLFGKAHADHYREVLGSVMLLTCCKVDQTGQRFSLSANAPDQLQRVGTSPGFAFCTALTKEGNPCRRAVDKTVTLFCDYHAMSRAANMRKAVQRPLASSSAPPLPAALWESGSGANSSAPRAVQHPVTGAGSRLGGQGVAIDASAARARLAEYIRERGGMAAIKASTATTQQQQRRLPAASSVSKVRAGLGLASKQRASGAPQERLPQGQKQQQQQQRQGGSGPASSSQRPQPPAPPPGSQAAAFAAAFGSVVASADAGSDMADRRTALAAAEHDAHLSSLLAQYERKDALACQVESITKLQVTAFHCSTCRTLTEKRHALCSGHAVERRQVTKRFWLCAACGWRLSTLGVVLPTKRCPKCRDPGMDFTPCAAMSAPKPAAGLSDAVASREALMPRGIEHAFSLKS